MDLRSQLQDHLGTAFRLDRELGGGGMSRVFVAYEHRLSRQIVIKVLSPELTQGLNAERFEREILLAASLQQANIVPVLTAGEVGGMPYFTMPFIEGESLRHRLTGNGLPINDTLAILRDVTRALAYAHGRGVVHRDIKPDNVLLSGDTAVVTDFGIAKALSASRTSGGGATLTSVGTSLGTPAYMAPEQVAGDPNIDHRVDLYALGCVAFELLVGRSPFADRAPQKMLAAHLSESPPPVESLRPDCPPALGQLVARLLAKDPADRTASARDVLSALDNVATTTSPTSHLTPQGRFLRALFIYAVAFLAVWILAKAAVVGIGLPEWTVPGAVGIMLLGLPVLLFTGWAKWVARRVAAATPTLTPGGSTHTASAGTMATIALKANRHLSWRRTARGGIYAMVGFVLLVSGFMITRALGVGPAASLFASGALGTEDRILLADFVTAPEDSALAPIVSEAVRAAMSQSGAVRILKPADVVQALAEMKRDGHTPITPDVASEIAERTGARAILGGRLARAGAGYLVSLELISTKGGAPLASFQGTADGASDLLNVVDELSRKLRGKVGESLRDVQRSIPLAQATTTSLEALRLYSDGARANDIDQDYERAVRQLRQAVALDSTFALAWRKLNAAMYNGGLSVAAQDSALERAVRYVDKLPLREQHLVRGAYYQQHSTERDRGRALNEYRALFALDSTETVALSQVGMIYDERSEFDSSLAYARRLEAIRPGPAAQYKVLAELIPLGKLDEANQVIDAIRKAAGGSAPGPLALAEASTAYARGELEQARAAAARARESSQPGVKLNGLGVALTLDAISGKLASAVAMDREASAFQKLRGESSLEGVVEAFADVEFRGHVAEGIALLDKIVNGAEWKAASSASRRYFDLARLYADAGAPEKARKLLALAVAEDPAFALAPANAANRASAEGLIALAEGRYPEALAKARAALLEPDGMPVLCRSCSWYQMARTHDAAGHADSAFVWLKRYIDLPAGERVRSDAASLAKARKRLGELYEKKGDRTSALAQYQAFVDQWANADAELQPAVAEIRARIKELTVEQ